MVYDDLMKIGTRALLLVFSSTLVACGTGSPDAYLEKSAKISCQFLRKCDAAMWNAAGFDSVWDCRDQLLDMDLSPGEGTLRDSFAESCIDFDREAARRCLASKREDKRNCDDSTIDAACFDVCNPPSLIFQVADVPLDTQLVGRALAELEATAGPGARVVDLRNHPHAGGEARVILRPADEHP